MPYRINGAEYQQGVFAVPNRVAEDYLRLAGGLSLKALLWMLRHGGEPLDAGAIAKALGKQAEDIEDALEYWIERGLVTEGGKAPPSVEALPADVPFPTPVSQASAIAPQAIAVPQARPTGTQIADSLDASPDLRWLFREEAPRILGHPIGYDGQSTLLMLRDTYGLPEDVIPMLLRYCVDIGKKDYAYIEKVGQNWGEKEIDSIEKADEKITALKRAKELWPQLCRFTGLSTPKPSPSQSEYLQCWQKDFGYGIDVILSAYYETADNTGKPSFHYMNKALAEWHKAGAKTPEDVAKMQEEWKAASPSRSRKKTSGTKKAAEAAPAHTPSYDLEEYERSTLQVPTFAKKEGA